MINIPVQVILIIAVSFFGYQELNTRSINYEMDITEQFSGTLFGSSVLIFDPGMKMQDIQSAIDSVHARQTSRDAEFSEERYALLFKPGRYRLDIKIGYYTQVAGLGESPSGFYVREQYLWEQVLPHLPRLKETRP